MSNIQHVIARVRQFYVPEMVLQVAFRNELRFMTIDAVIKQNIVAAIVLKDLNLYAGKLARIPLRAEWLKPMTSVGLYPAVMGSGVYQIPPEAREYKDITVPLEITYPSNTVWFPGGGNNSACVKDAMENIAGTAMASVNYNGYNTTPTPILMGSNIIRLEPTAATHVDWIFSCLLEYDIEFTNINESMVTQLVKLVSKATQAVIYNKLINQMQIAVMVSGAEMDTIRGIVERWESAAEEYQELLLETRGAAVFDQEQVVSMISMMC
jgi:hypothetical protein